MSGHDRPRVGVLLPSRCGSALDSESAARVIALAVRAEALGFDSVWAGESILARPRLEPLTLLAGVASRTERIALGTAVMLPALHPPLQLAQRLATLDAVASGRLIVGAGIGIDDAATRREFAAAGVPFEQRVGRLVATVHVCRSLWSTQAEAAADDAPGRATAYWDLRGARLEPKPHQKDGPPFWIGATFAREAALRRTGRGFDGWIPTAPSADAYAAGWGGVAAAAVEAGRATESITPAVYLTISIDDDPRVAESALRAYLTDYYGLPFEVMRQVQGVFAGTAEDGAAWLRGYLCAGARHLVLRTPDLGSQLDGLAEGILPRLRGSDA